MRALCCRLRVRALGLGASVLVLVSVAIVASALVFGALRESLDARSAARVAAAEMSELRRSLLEQEAGVRAAAPDEADESMATYRSGAVLERATVARLRTDDVTMLVLQRRRDIVVDPVVDGQSEVDGSHLHDVADPRQIDSERAHP